MRVGPLSTSPTDLNPPISWPKALPWPRLWTQLPPYSIPIITWVQSKSIRAITQHPLLHLLSSPPILLHCSLSYPSFRCTTSLNVTPSSTRSRPSTTPTSINFLSTLFSRAKWDRFLVIPSRAPSSERTLLFQQCLPKASRQSFLPHPYCHSCIRLPSWSTINSNWLYWQTHSCLASLFPQYYFPDKLPCVLQGLVSLLRFTRLPCERIQYQYNATSFP